MAVRPLKATFVERIWGATDLAPLFDNIEGKRIGEVWLTADPPLPLLFKFIFTTEKLSVQVHPSGEAGTGKTEMWHILSAQLGATVAAGFTREVSKEEVRTAALDGSIEGLLQSVPVQPGDSIFIPAGTVHAIGGGLTLFEIQQNSDITYRLYDYGRPRELHLDQGLAISHLFPHEGIHPRQGERLVSCEYFETERISVTESRVIRNAVVTAIEGEGTIDTHVFCPGMSYLIEGEAILEGRLEAIVARIP